MSALLDTGQIAAMLGVTRAHVTDNLTKRPDFPAPVVNVSQKLRRWKESDIRQWLAREARKAQPRAVRTRRQAAAGGPT